MRLMIGPFRTFDLLLTGIILAVILVICAVARGALSMPFYIAGWVLLAASASLIAPVALFGITIYRYWANGREGFIFSIARALGLPVYVDVELGTNIAEFVLGEKENPKDIIFKDEESGIKIDPGLLSKDAMPMSFSKGLCIYIYSYFNFMPQSINNTAAFKAIEEFFMHDDSCAPLRFLTIKEFCELISCPEHYLEHNSLTKLNKYFKISERQTVVEVDGKKKVETVKVRNEKGEMVPQMCFVRQFYDEEKHKWTEQDILLPEMVQLIASARKEVARLPCHAGLLAGTEAFKNNSVAYSAQHLSHVLMLYDDIRRLTDDNKEKILVYCIGAAIVLLGGGLAYYIINMAGACSIATGAAGAVTAAAGAV